MNKLLALICLSVATSAAHAASCSGTACTFYDTDLQTTIQGDLNNASYSSYTFTAGTYGIAGRLTFRCNGGQTYTGPTVTGPVYSPNKQEPTAIITTGNSYYNDHAIYVNGTTGFTSPGAGCSISYLEVQDQNIYVTQGSTGISINHVWVDGISMLNNSSNWEATPAIMFEGTSGTASCSDGVCYSNIEWSNNGNNCTDVAGSPTDPDNYGVCGSFFMHGYVGNVEIANNFMTGGTGYEGIKIASATSGVQYVTNFSAHNNDLSNTHRIGIESQADACTGTNTLYGNSYHDDYNPDRNTMGISSANCAPLNGASSPSFVNHDNTIVGNIAATATCGSVLPGGPPNSGCFLAYGEEQWGNAPQVYNLLLQGDWVHGLVMGGQSPTCSPIACPSAAGSFTNNIVEGPNMTSGSMSTTPFIGCEDGGTYPGSCTYVTGSVTDLGNSTNNTVTAQTSTAPAIYLSAGGTEYPVTVQPNNTATNQSAWCTTDGSTPVPGSGTAAQYDPIDGTSFAVNAATTIQCVGMWGQGGNTAAWPAGYGWIASGVVSITYNMTVTTVSGGTVVISSGVVQVS